MKLKTILVGYLCGFIFTWAMWIIMPIIMGCSDKLYILIQPNTIARTLQQALIVGLVFALGLGVIGWLGNRNRRKEELEKEMIEYFRSQRKEKEG